MRTHLASLVALLCVGACESPPVTPDVPALDSGIADIGMDDTGVGDIGMDDTGVGDTGTPDVPAMDSGAADSGIDDTGVGDTGTPDVPELPDAGVDACTLLRSTLTPTAIGHVAFWPDLGGMREVNPAGAIVVSSYFRTTPENGEFRRGIAEFTVPSEAAAATSALLRFRTTARPTEVHQIVSYPDADGVVTITDYNRPSSSVGRITTADVVEYTIDVLPLLRSRAGLPLGLRVEVAPPLDTTTALTAFSVQLRDVRIEIEIPCS